MDIKKQLLKLAGKDDFILDSEISKKYLLRVCWKYGWMMVRGKLFAFGHKNISNDVFIGKHVKVLEKRKISMGHKVRLQDGVYIDALSDTSGGVLLGNYVVIGRNTRIECTGGLSNVGRGVRIGNRTTFGNNCVFGAVGGIEIGDDVVAGQNIRFHAENHNYEDMDRLIREQGVTRKGIKIGNNSWIGAGAVFLDGSQIGDGCVVAANAVVTKKFPDNSVIGGVPARVIKYRGVDSGNESRAKGGQL